MTSLELLAPAKNLECGIAAIDHGADAVYIGAPRFGARAAAGNSVADIAELCRYAHQFGAKVYVTTNTIVFDSELDDTFRLIEDLKTAGVDALLVQDMAIIQEFRSPGVQEFRSSGVQEFNSRSSFLPIHASTQTDNRTAEKVAWLRAQGFQRVVLARELSLEEIREIHHRVPDVELEVFVHGALCVSYSGQCYISQHCQGRSANRGECAQMCRMKYDLVDADGREIEHQRHLLSLKDLCRIDDLEALADAGAVSFKIEGRLKDVDYVKNVVSAYSQRLDDLCRRRPDDFQRASQGRVTYFFTPNLQKTFNRGFTDYFLHCHRDEHGRLQGRQADIASFDTPKALGEYVGKVKEIHGNSFTVAGTAAFANGDGLCFFKASPPNPLSRKRGGTPQERISDGMDDLLGFRVNRAEGNRLFPLKMPDGLRPGMALYRNNDMAFEKLMAGKTAERKIPLRMTFRTTDEGFELEAASRDAVSKVALAAPKTPARTPQRENIVRQLTKLGNTPFVCDDFVIEGDAGRYFIPSSQLAELRRQINPVPSPSPQEVIISEKSQKNHLPIFGDRGGYLLNVANRFARDFYERQGVAAVEPAFELKVPQNALLMQCRHCLRYSLGHCVKLGGSKPSWREPLSLRLADGRKFRLEFDCRNCQMNLLAE
ncbi:MAG: U32 family peptidase [Prevotella sp.]|nr:U32 family peptidase [Prevotella sp.]